jgi:aminoglycoside phosphotransferase (APT) family kinase protein
MDNEVIGTWFYVMQRVEGRIFWDASLAQVDSTLRPGYFDAMNATLAQLHSVDYRRIGLGDFGRPDNYLHRQVARWSKQYASDTAVGRDAHMDRLIDWLLQNIPSSHETTLIHGDFRIDNMIFQPARPSILAVLDWELSTLGDPLADFANHAMMYHMPPHIVAGLAGTDVRSLNIPCEDEYVAAYCRRTGRAEIVNYRFYLAFSFFRMAAIFHGIKGRALRGTASSQHAFQRGELFGELARIGLALTGR